MGNLDRIASALERIATALETFVGTTPPPRKHCLHEPVEVAAVGKNVFRECRHCGVPLPPCEHPLTLESYNAPAGETVKWCAVCETKLYVSSG